MRAIYDIQSEIKDQKERLKVYQQSLITDGDTKHVVPITALFEWPDNPKKAQPHDMDRLQKQIEKLGQYKPVIVEPNGQVLGGNHRLKKYRDMGITFVWVSIVEPKTEEARMEYALSDNDHIAEYEQEQLAEKLKELKNIDLSLFKVNLGPLTTLAELMDKFADSPPEDDVPDLPATAVSRLGEIYQLGEHRLICGDATVAAYYDALMNGETAQMVFTDPPYNVDYQGSAGNKREGILNDKMSEQAFYRFLVDSLTRMMERTKGAFYVCMSKGELYNLHPAFIEAGGHYQTIICWVKNTFNLSGGDWQPMYEPILYGWNKKYDRYYAGYRDEPDVWTNLEALKPVVDADGNTVIKLGMFTLKINGKVTGTVSRKRDITDIWEEKKPSRSDEHPTMKPVKLCSKAIRASSERGAIVLDPFGGSGSTLIAAERTQRKCYMMELDPRYIDVIIKRYENVTGQSARKLGEITVK